MKHRKTPSGASDTTGSAWDTADSAWVAMDLEYTGSSSAPHLLEVGAVMLQDGEIQDHFQTLVAPPVPIDPESTLVHGIADPDVRSAPFAQEVLPAFFDWLGALPLVAHGAKADARVLGFECARQGRTPPNNALYDSLELAKRAWSDSPDHRLETLVEFLELETSAAHRALSDATACSEVTLLALSALAEAGEQDGMEGRSRTGLLHNMGTPQRLAAALPATPHRRPAQLRVLKRAREAGDTITMLYGAPPQISSLEVRPTLLYRTQKRDYLEAECIRSGSLKTYRLDRIQKLIINDSCSA